jgi:hypothetical protein
LFRFQVAFFSGAVRRFVSIGSTHQML